MKLITKKEYLKLLDFAKEFNLTQEELEEIIKQEARKIKSIKVIETIYN